MFNVGDVVAVDLNAPYRGQCGVNDDMTTNFHGREFTISSSHETSDGTRYTFGSCHRQWVYVDEWLTLVRAAPEPAMVECYDGEMHSENRCYLLTEPSQFAGMYAPWADSQERVVQNPRRHVVMLTTEFDEMMICIQGDWYVKDTIDEDDIVECTAGSYRGQLIFQDNSIYVESDGDVFHEDDNCRYFWYDDRAGEYTTNEPCDDDNEGSTLSYHATKDNGYVHKTNPETLCTIGFEVEKEDGDILSSYDTSDVPEGWTREHDGSLDDDTGYELVSPIYDLFDDKLDKALTNYTLKEHINADSTTACGGHINYGRRGMTGAELLKESAGFIPLFLALYRKRVLSRWSKMDVNIENYDGSERYVAFNVKDNYIEFRLIARFHDVDTLLWRRDLFRIMANNGGKSVTQVQRMMLDRRNVLHKHLRKMYTEERLLRLVCWYSQFADAMHDTLSVSQTGHGVMLDFFLSSLKRNKKRVSVGMADVIGWANEVSDILSRANGGRKYAENVKPLSCEALKFLNK